MFLVKLQPWPTAKVGGARGAGRRGDPAVSRWPRAPRLLLRASAGAGPEAGESRAPPFLWQGSSLLCLPGACPQPSSLCSSLHPSWLPQFLSRASELLLFRWVCRPKGRVSCLQEWRGQPLLHLLSGMSGFQRSLLANALTNSHQEEVSPGRKNRRGSAAKTASTRSPQRGSPHLRVTALIMASPRLVGALASLPPSCGAGRELLSPCLFPRGRCHKAFGNCFRCGGTAHSGLTPLSSTPAHRSSLRR